MPSMTKDEFKENLEVTDINRPRQLEVYKNSLSGEPTPPFQVDAQLEELAQAKRKPAMDTQPAPKRSMFNGFGIFSRTKPEKSASKKPEAPTPKTPRTR